MRLSFEKGYYRQPSNDTKFTDAGLKDIAKLQKLTFLELGDTKITDEDAAELKKALPKCDIRSNPTK